MKNDPTECTSNSPGCSIIYCIATVHGYCTICKSKFIVTLAHLTELKNCPWCGEIIKERIYLNES